MVCIAVKGEPVIGVIHKPFEGKTYWAWVGHGMADELHELNKAVTKKICLRFTETIRHSQLFFIA